MDGLKLYRKAIVCLWGLALFFVSSLFLATKQMRRESTNKIWLMENLNVKNQMLESEARLSLLLVEKELLNDAENIFSKQSNKINQDFSKNRANSRCPKANIFDRLHGILVTMEMNVEEENNTILHCFKSLRQRVSQSSVDLRKEDELIAMETSSGEDLANAGTLAKSRAGFYSKSFLRAKDILEHKVPSEELQLSEVQQERTLLLQVAEVGLTLVGSRESTLRMSTEAKDNLKSLASKTDTLKKLIAAQQHQAATTQERAEDWGSKVAGINKRQATVEAALNTAAKRRELLTQAFAESQRELDDFLPVMAERSSELARSAAALASLRARVRAAAAAAHCPLPAAPAVAAAPVPKPAPRCFKSSAAARPPPGS